MKLLKQTRNQLLNTRNLFRVKKINVILTWLHNFELILINSQNCQILIFETRTIFCAHSISFFTIHHQYYNNLYNIIKKFESILLWDEFFIRLSHKIRITIVNEFSNKLINMFWISNYYLTIIIILLCNKF